MQKRLATVAFTGPLKLKRESVAPKTVDVVADVDLATGEVKLRVSDRDLQKLRQDAEHSAR